MADRISLDWSKKIVKDMFPMGAGSNIEQHFPLVERQFELVFGHIPITGLDVPRSFTPNEYAKNLDLMRLKVYTYATVRAECDDFLPHDEGARTVKRNGAKGDTSGLTTGARSSLIPIWADDPSPRPHRMMVRDYSDPGLSRLLPIASEAVPGSGNLRPNQPYGFYDSRTKRIVGAKDANDLKQLYRGRGFIQLKGLANYTRIGKHIGADLMFSPWRAISPPVAAAVLVAFMEESKDKIIQALSKEDFTAARRAVSGGTNGLSESTEAYRIGFRQATF